VLVWYVGGLARAVDDAGQQAGLDPAGEVKETLAGLTDLHWRQRVVDAGRPLPSTSARR
jgi:hypothetical protein